MRFVLDFTESALEDLVFFKKFEQTIILEQIEVQLCYQPMITTRNRKPLELNTIGEWELRIGVYRVFYDVDLAEAIVKVKAIGYKDHNRLYIKGREYIL